eukprot:m.6932 g.6932  ORF g.6932 m.6932 type:complete len:128 (-) comp5206_c0_seq2:256-639(-)
MYTGGGPSLLKAAPFACTGVCELHLTLTKLCVISTYCTANYTIKLAGGLSGAMYWTAFYPADTVKSLQQGTQKYANSSFITIFRDVLKNDGFKALYRGWGLTVTRAIPSNAVLFATYELVTRMLKDV